MYLDGNTWALKYLLHRDFGAQVYYHEVHYGPLGLPLSEFLGFRFQGSKAGGKTPNRAPDIGCVVLEVTIALNPKP